MVEKGKKGHRQRLRERFLAEEDGSRSDEALLELILTYSITRKDVQPIAQELLRIFGGFSQVLAGSPEKLEKVGGIGQSSVALLKLIHSLTTEPTLAAEDDATPEGKMHSTSLNPSHQARKPTSGTKLKGNLKNSGEEWFELVATQRRSDSAEQETDQTASASTSRKTLKTATTSTKKTSRRKFQVSNGYLLEFDQLSRVLHFLFENREAKKISRKVLQENTGLADRQLASLVSMGAAMGLIRPGLQILSPAGLLIAEHDIFIEKKASLEWCHYTGAGSYQNLIWFEIFNHLIPSNKNMPQADWSNCLREKLAGQYSGRTIKKSLREEVHFVVDAYTEQNLRKLELLQKAPDERLYIRRYTNFTPLVFSAMLYDFGADKGSQLLQVDELAVMPGSPALLFGLDTATLRQQVEGLHERGWLRYETTHNLDQVRLKSSFSALEFLTAHFEVREPREAAASPAGDLFQ